MKSFVLTGALTQLIFSANAGLVGWDVDCVTKNEILCYTMTFFYNIQRRCAGLYLTHTVYEAIQARFVNGRFF